MVGVVFSVRLPQQQEQQQPGSNVFKSNVASTTVYNIHNILLQQLAHQIVFVC